jgi:hypothetical protein
MTIERKMEIQLIRACKRTCRGMGDAERTPQRFVLGWLRDGSEQAECPMPRSGVLPG